ncbi:hypothetical protein G7K_6799-t1 [Saitoella complicata NRRL Y-17804]|uniref:CAF1B/HIR1 beta-propeller domain-containing protein n=1 Tax=Saitoella complicata (strain BCRC 22490 / CBS 7301 / JCM 7358 / NBRC 10748 / NRRL Y-17804) TaxID=698492 RepID=A0A0E9NS98_SAICN|nr:hypothetical protein G7K_6799-t1 [Saitoella complicata NRRL Y-17804]
MHLHARVCTPAQTSQHQPSILLCNGFKMKAKAIQISWHDTQPIYSAHFSPSHPNKLATAGGDNNVRIWRLDLPSTSSQSQPGVEGAGPEEDDGFPRVTYLATLSRHTQAVNVVRWSPKGEVLASAGDDGNVLLWVPDTTHTHHQSTTSSPSTPSTPHFGDTPDKDPYRVKIMCRPPLPSEIYDLAWSPCGSFVLTGSMDNVARIYRASDGTCVRQIAEHVHYVQGVAWDPRGEWVATQGSDRSVHVYSVGQQHEGKEKERGRTLEVGGGMKSSRMEVPAHLLPTTTTRPTPPHLDHQTSNTPSIPAASPPGTPGLVSLNLGPGAVPTRMDPPLATPASHSRRGSFSSVTSSSRRSISPSPSGMVLPAVSVSSARPGSSPKLGPTSSSSAGLPPLPVETGAGAGGVGAGLGGGGKGAKTMSLYANEQLLSFFRRLCWAPDGSLLFAPAGVWNPRLESSSNSAAASASGSGSCSATSANASEEKKEVNTVYIYSRAGLGKPPVAHLPGLKKPAVAVRCSPIYYKLRPQPLDDESDTPSKEDVVKEGKPVFALPYRIIYAVATQDSV